MRISSLLFLALLFTTSARAEEFITSYWYGPPPEQTTFERYQEIKDANFNVVFPPALGNCTPDINHHILNFCQRLGMKAVISDARMPLSLEAPSARQNLAAIVADYKNHPALFAYFITDEPSASAFPALAQVNAHLKKLDPHHPGFINLFPTYAAPGSQLGTETYIEYLDRFARQFKPAVISFDHYPFIQSHDRPDFFENLAHVRNAAIKHDKPFWFIAQLTQHYDYRALTEPELRFQAMQALAFGTRGLLWYTYWYPGPSIPTVAGSPINHDGTRNEHYDIIKRINAESRAIGNELLQTKSWATFHTGDPVLLLPPRDPSPIEPTGPGSFTTGIFLHKDGHHLALIANRDYRKEIKSRARVRSRSASIERYDPNAHQWRKAERDEAGELEIHLSAGSAILLRLK